MKSLPQKSLNGFSLVELAVVIVIISLLITSVLAGKRLVESSEAKSLLSEVQKLKSSIGQFQALYRAMPGDLPNATSYWPAAANGNGNGRINAEPSNEPFGAIQQLFLANLIQVTGAGFTGVWGSRFVIPNESGSGNVIGARGRDGAAIFVRCCSGTDYARPSLDFNNYIGLFFGANIATRGGILSPQEASEIDRKVDDGNPDGGFVGADGRYDGGLGRYAAIGCYTGTGGGADYDTSQGNSQTCQMMFAYDWNDFRN